MPRTPDESSPRGSWPHVSARHAAEAQRREAAAREQAKADKDRLREEYILAGGDPAGFEDFWKIKGPEMVAERMRARMARVADPRDYMSGSVGGHVEPSPTFGPADR